MQEVSGARRGRLPLPPHGQMLAVLALAPLALGVRLGGVGFCAHPSLVKARIGLRPVCQIDDEELDAMDTSDTWDAQLEAQRRWEADQAAKKTERPQTNRADWYVDEEAHFGLGDNAEHDDDLGGVENFKQKLMASELLNQVREAAGGASGSADNELSNKRILTSLESVISTLIRLNDKIDSVIAKLERMEKEGQSGASTPPPPIDDGGWDGDAIEGAHFDYDDDDPLIN